MDEPFQTISAMEKNLWNLQQQRLLGSGYEPFHLSASCFVSVAEWHKPLLVHKLAPVHRRQGVMGGRFNKQEDWLTRLVLAKRWVDPCTYPPNLKSLTRGPNGAQSWLLPRWTQQHIAFSGCILEAAPSAGAVGGIHIGRKGEGWGTSDCPGPAHRSTNGHILLMTSSKFS